MLKLDFKRAYYLKLGESGAYETELNDGIKARIGWKNIDIADIITNNWNRIFSDIKKDFQDRSKNTGWTNDYNALKTFCEITENDVVITFANSKLYWCKLSNEPIQKDNISKFRNTQLKWSSQNIFGKELYINEISGKITKTIGFKATLCNIDEIETLKRIINGERNPIVIEIENKKNEIIHLLLEALSNLHWKDFEILTDLIFRQSGWQRISMLGESMKYADLELEDPITKDKYQVQVKASAGINEFEEYAKNFINSNFRKLFFVVFQPKNELINYKHNYENIQILTGIELCKMIIDLGLMNWVLNRIN